MGLAYCMLGIMGDAAPHEVFPKAKASVTMALELDDTLADAHATMGLIKLVYDRDWGGAERETKRALALNPSSSEAHSTYGGLLLAMSRRDEAVNEIREALRLDPLAPAMNSRMAWMLYFAGRYDESIAHNKKTLELAPDLPWVYMVLAWNYADKQMYADAIFQCQTAIGLVPESQVVLGTCGKVYGQAGRRKDALALLGRLMHISERALCRSALHRSPL
jgi:tetratricopeptide (TPR) repeat protein